MKQHSRFLWILTFFCVSILGFPPTSHAATQASLGIHLSSVGATCNTTSWRSSASAIGITPEWGETYDLWAVLIFDGAGVPLVADWVGSRVGSPFTHHRDFGNGAMNQITARPFHALIVDIRTQPPYGANTAEVYNNIYGQWQNGAPVLATFDYDPAWIIPDCATLPYIARVGYPQLDTLKLETRDAQPAYGDPNGEIAKNERGEIWLPADADGSDFDTYVVTATVEIDGQIWVQLFLGSANFVWLPLDD